jgi:hypothetical protein
MQSAVSTELSTKCSESAVKVPLKIVLELSEKWVLNFSEKQVFWPNPGHWLHLQTPHHNTFAHLQRSLAGFSASVQSRRMVATPAYTLTPPLNPYSRPNAGFTERFCAFNPSCGRKEAVRSEH